MKKATNKKLSLDKLNITKLSKQNTIKGGIVYNTYQFTCQTDLTVRPRATNTTTGCSSGQCEAALN